MTPFLDRTRRIRVLISDMSPLITSGIEAALDHAQGFETRQGAISSVLSGEHDTSQPFDVIIIESEPALRLLHPKSRQALPDSLRHARVFVINQSSGEREIRVALESGVQGYATFALTLEELREGVRMVAREMRYICPRTAQRLADSLMREQLTAREADVLEELARGRCNKTIGQELGMALGTVKAHVKALMSKLDAETRTQVVTVAIVRGLVKLDRNESLPSGVLPFEPRSTTRAKLQLAA